MKYILALILSAVPVVAFADTVETFSIEDAIAHDIDGCGYQYSLPTDFQSDAGQTTAFVFVNDGNKGLVKIDSRFITLTAADDGGKGTYESEDHLVNIEPKTTIGQKLGIELWKVQGNLTFTVKGHRQVVPVLGYMGC